jgi:hypothetical protein
MARASWTLALLAAGTAAAASCGPLVPEAGSAKPESSVSVSRIDPAASTSTGATIDATAPLTSQAAGSQELEPATPLTSAKATMTAGKPLLAGSSAEGPLALPTIATATKSWLFLFGRSNAGWVVRAYDKKGNKGFGAPVLVAPAYPDDAPPIAANDADNAWFAVSSTKAMPTRLARVEVSDAGKVKLVKVSPREDGADATPRGMGAIRGLVALHQHIAVVGRDGDAISFARLSRSGAFLDSSARTIARGTASLSTTLSRSPRVANEDDRVLLAWDADTVAGSLETPGTLPAEAANPKSGIYVQRFAPSGDSLGPARRLTRPSFEAHTLDVAVELGACAVLATTPNGFEMFRFVRKGDDMLPYGGGLFLSAPTTDVSLATDVIGTVAITPTKLLRIGPGVKIVPSPLSFSPPAGASSTTFETAQIASDGYGDHAIFQSRTPSGLVQTIARIDNDHTGPALPPPWIGPPPQRLVFADYETDEGIVLVVDGGALQLTRVGADGSPRGAATPVPWDLAKLDALSWPRASVPRTAHAGGNWAIGLRDGRVLVATGPKAGTTLSLGVPRGCSSGGTIALTSVNGKPGKIRVFYVPRAERDEALATATIDLATAAIDEGWSPIDGTEHHYGALGNARWLGVRRQGGGLYLLANSGPKVSIAAQNFDVVAVGGLGEMLDLPTLAPYSVQDLVLVPTLQGAALVASLSGKGSSARWLDVGGPWKQAATLNAFRTQGDGPIVRDPKTGAALALAGVPSAPVEIAGDVAAAASDHCPWVLPSGPRSALMVCEEGSGDSPLASRVTLRSLSL